MGMVFDNNSPLVLKKGKSFALSSCGCFVCNGNDLSDCILPLHRFMRKFVIPKSPSNNPLLVTYNPWYAYGATIDEKKLLQAIPLVADIGCEAFVLDANWHYCPGDPSLDWSDRLGDWVIDPKKYPNGLAPVIKAVRDRGMKFGLWLEPEVASLNSNVLKEHPDWFIKHNGKLMSIGSRSKRNAHLDFAKKEVRDWATGVIERLMKRRANRLA